jgi:membrane fusion protein (multidrug efflux system)
MSTSGAEKRRTGLVWAVLVIAGFAVFTGVNIVKQMQADETPPEAKEAVPVAVFQATRRTLESRLSLIGNVQPAIAVNVFSRVSGQIIASIAVDKGDLVNVGDVIATLARDVIDARLAEARAGLAAANAGRKQALARMAVLEKDRQRLAALYDQNAIARQQLDHIEAETTATAQAIHLAEAQEKRAQAVIRQLMVQSDNHTIRAPAAGIIAQRQVDPGALTAPGMPIVSIADEKTVKVVFQVTENDLPRLRPGMHVTVSVDALADARFDGQVDLIGPTVDPASRSAAVETRLANPDGRLAPGMYARVSVLMETRDCLVIPSDGLVRVPGTGERFVFVVDGNRAVQRNVVTGLVEGSLVEISTGVSAGEAVVVRGQGRLLDGTPVRVADTATSQRS